MRRFTGEQKKAEADPASLSPQAYLKLFEERPARGHIYQVSKRGDGGRLASKEPSRLEKALAQAHDLRKFEIDLYWKRAAYFWAFIAASFVGFAACLNASTPHLMGALVMCALGYTFTYAWSLANRGSKFWQENWENHVNLLEDAVTGPIHKLLAMRHPTVSDDQATSEPSYAKPGPYSVTKLNTVISRFVLLIWVELALGLAALWIYQIAFSGPPTRVHLAVTHLVGSGLMAVQVAWFARKLKRESETHKGQHTLQVTLRDVTVVGAK